MHLSTSYKTLWSRTDGIWLHCIWQISSTPRPRPVCIYWQGCASLCFTDRTTAEDRVEDRRWWSCAEGSSVKRSGEMIRVSAPWAQGVRVVYPLPFGSGGSLSTLHRCIILICLHFPKHTIVSMIQQPVGRALNSVNSFIVVAFDRNFGWHFLKVSIIKLHVFAGQSAVSSFPAGCTWNDNGVSKYSRVQGVQSVGVNKQNNVLIGAARKRRREIESRCRSWTPD